MISYDEKYGIVGSFLEPIPYLNSLQSRFNTKASMQWLHDNLPIPVIASLVYVVLVFLGSIWMKKKKAYKLNQPLLFWNVSLAVFSLLGALSMLPNLVHGVYKQGLFYSVCLGESTTNPNIGLWGFIFVLSKIFEFIDTAFLILRKKPVNFLHWYHHTTVLVFSWYVLGTWSTATGLWFSSINYFVHTLMYGYYSLRSASIRVPSDLALLITVLQILQMFVGLFVNCYVYYQSIVLEKECNTMSSTIYMGLVVYGSYAILFMNFFLGRYIWRSKGKTE